MAFNFYQPPQGDYQQAPNQPKPHKTISISPKLLLGLIIAIVLVAVVLSSFFVVDQTEQAVVLRFGKYTKTVGPGLQFKLPLGIEQNYNVPTQVVQTMTFGYRPSGSNYRVGTDYTNESIMLTGDLNIIDIEWIVQYKITNPYNWLFQVSDKPTTIHDVSRSVMNQLVGDLPILSVMTDRRVTIEEEAQQMMQDIFDRYKMGVQVVTVKLQNIVPPEGAVQDAFEDVNKAIQDMNRLINEGKENYNSLIPAAEGEAAKAILQAQGYAAERVNQASGDVARFMAVQEQYESSKDITKTRLYIETMESVLSSQEGSITLIDKNVENFLPLSSITSGGTK